MAAACSSLQVAEGPRQTAAAWAAERGFAPIPVQADGFQLAAFMRRQSTRVDTLAVYIEGDGAAWPSPYHPPHDPTPTKPLVLTLAASDPSDAVVYLGRPCQYLDAAALARCPTAYWIDSRYAANVVAAYDSAVAELKAALAAQRIRLVGYSGGGVIAALVAARRRDVDSLVTIAAPLALGEWVKWHGASPLAGSLDPVAIEASPSAGVHFVGGNDKTVPPAIVERFVRVKGGRAQTVAEFDHECCWARDWPSLLRQTLVQEETP